MIYVKDLKKEFKKTIKEPGIKGSIKSFFKPEKEIVTAVNDISFEIEKGELVGIIGHTGSGKSTLIQHFNGLLKPTSGQVILNGKDIWEKKEYVRQSRF